MAMAGTIQQPWSDEIAESWSSCSSTRESKVDPHRVTQISVWLHGFYNPSRAWKDLRGHGLLVSTHRHGEEPCVYETHFQAPPAFVDSSAFVAWLRACAKNRDLLTGIRIHDDVLEKGLLEKCSNALVAMYARCGALTKAKGLLYTHKNRNVAAWTALIAAYVQHGQSQNALECFERMLIEGLSPDAVTFVCVLKACGSLKAADKGEKFHDDISRQGLLEKDAVVGTALVDMYAKCGALVKAQQVLEKLPFQDVISWNALITGYVQQGQGEQAWRCFERMQYQGVHPNAVTFICILKACGSLGAVDRGEQIHDEVVRQGLLVEEIKVGNALVDMYAKCGILEKAERVLRALPSRNVITWNTLIVGYAHAHRCWGERALKCLEDMRSEGLSPNAVTFTCILKVVGSIKATDKGEQIHNEIALQGLLRESTVLGTALVDMYAKCGAIAKAKQVLEELPSRDVVAWSALIAGCTQQGQFEQALNCFEQMQREAVAPNVVTFACILKACACLGMIHKGEQIHDEIARQGLLEKNLELGTSLVDMYAKCGALAKAHRLFEELPSHDVVSWSALIVAYAQQGHGEQALSCYAQMQQEGLLPDAVMFSCVLNVCSQLGLVEEAHMHFVNMSKKYGVKPSLEHYACMVDLFGRAGHLDKAVEVIREMPSYDGMAIWSALLGASQKWGDVLVGRWAFEQAMQVDKNDAAAHIMMANLYASAGMQEDARFIEALRRKNI